MKKALFLFTLFLIFTTCSKDDSASSDVSYRPRTGLNGTEGLSTEELAILDNLPPAIGFSPKTVILPNGEILDDYLKKVDPEFHDKWLRSDPYENLGPQAARNLLIGYLSTWAFILTDREKMARENGQPNGIAYSYNSKNHKKEQSPLAPVSLCKDQIFGLDCSGFIYQLFVNAGVNIPVGTADEQRKTTVLEKAIKAAIPALDKVKVDDLGQIPANKFESGDIIYWLDGSVADHIGIVLKKPDGNLAVFASNGNKHLTCDECKGPSRGPTIIPLNKLYIFGPNRPYGITRINADISGDWEFKFRCEGINNPDFITHELKFPTTSSSTFSITKSFIDTDGSTNKTIFEFNYDKSTNTLSCAFVTTDGDIPGAERKDSFSVKLEKDLMDYFSAKQDYIKNSEGCTLEVRLKNLN